MASRQAALSPLVRGRLMDRSTSTLAAGAEEWSWWNDRVGTWIAE